MMSTESSLIYACSNKPEVLTISFEREPKADLGVQLRNLDKDEGNASFFPGYISVLKLKDGDNLARRCGVEVGDYLVAVSGTGFRRIQPDFDESNLSEEKYRVIAGKNAGEHYKFLLNHIKSIKKMADPNNALILSFERYQWDSRPNSWPRFLAARNNITAEAMEMMQNHESWRNSTFPIDHLSLGDGTFFKSGAIKEICVKGLQHPIAYINCAKLSLLGDNDHIVKALLATNETFLSMKSNGSSQKISYLIHISKELNFSDYHELMETIYTVFEANYPMVIHKIAVFPVLNVEALTFISKETREKIFCTQVDKTAFYHLGLSEKKISNCEDIDTLIQNHGKDMFNLPVGSDTADDDSNFNDSVLNDFEPDGVPKRSSLDDLTADELYHSIAEFRQQRMLELEEQPLTNSVKDFDLLTAIKETSDKELTEAVSKLREGRSSVLEEPHSEQIDHSDAPASLSESTTKELENNVSALGKDRDAEMDSPRQNKEQQDVAQKLNVKSKNKLANAVTSLREQRNMELEAMRKNKNHGVKNELKVLADAHFSSVVSKIKAARDAELSALKRASAERTGADKVSDSYVSSRQQRERQQRALEMEQLRGNKTKDVIPGRINVLARKDKDKLSSSVQKMREKREAEMNQMKKNRVGDGFREVAANLNFGAKDAADSSVQKIKKSLTLDTKRVDDDVTKVTTNSILGTKNVANSIVQKKKESKVIETKDTSSEHEVTKESSPSEKSDANNDPIDEKINEPKIVLSPMKNINKSLTPKSDDTKRVYNDISKVATNSIANDVVDPIAKNKKGPQASGTTDTSTEQHGAIKESSISESKDINNDPTEEKINELKIVVSSMQNINKVLAPKSNDTKRVDNDISKVTTNSTANDMVDSITQKKKESQSSGTTDTSSEQHDAVKESSISESNDTNNNRIDKKITKPKIVVKCKSVDVALAKKDEEKLHDSVILLRKQREDEMKQMTQNKAGNSGRNLVAKLFEGKSQGVSGIIQEQRKKRDEEMKCLRQNKESSKHRLQKECIEINLKESNNAINTPPRDFLGGQSIVEENLEELSKKTPLKAPASVKESNVKREDNFVTPAKVPEFSKSNLIDGMNARESFATPPAKLNKRMTSMPLSKKKDCLPLSLTKESKQKELADAVEHLRGQRSAEIAELRRNKSTSVIQEQIFGAKDFQGGSSQSHNEEFEAFRSTSVISIRDAMLIPLVNYKNNDFRTFIFILHKDYGIMLLQFKNKVLKRDDFKIPGGRVVEKEFMASARISGGDVQKELVNASKIAAARELYDGTGIDLRENLERFTPLLLWKEKHESIESDYSCELKKRVFFTLHVDDGDFISKDNVSDEESQLLVSSELENSQALMLSKESFNFSFHKDFTQVADLIRSHSGSISSKALLMALEIQSLDSMHKTTESENENNYHEQIIDEDLYLPKKKAEGGLLSCLTCWK